MLSPITLGFLLSTIGATLCAVVFRIVANYAAQRHPTAGGANSIKSTARSPKHKTHSSALGITGSGSGGRTRWQPDYGTFWSLKLLRLTVYASVTIMLPIYIHGGPVMRQQGISSGDSGDSTTRAHVLLVCMIVPPMMCGLAPLLLCWSGPQTKAAAVWAALLLASIAPVYGYIQHIQQANDQPEHWATRVPEVLQGAMLSVVCISVLVPMLFTLRRLIGPLPAARHGLVNNNGRAGGARAQLQASAGVAGWHGWRAHVDTRSVEYQSMRLWLPSSVLLLIALGLLLPLYAHPYAGLASASDGGTYKDMLLYGVLGLPLLAMLLLGEGKVRRGCEAYVTVAVTIVYPLAVLLPIYVHATEHDTTKALLLSVILAMPLLLFAAGGVGAVWQACGKTEAKLAGRHFQLEVMLRQYRVRCEQYRRAFEKLIENVYIERAEQRLNRRHRMLKAAGAITANGGDGVGGNGGGNGGGIYSTGGLGTSMRGSRGAHKEKEAKDFGNLVGNMRKISDREFGRKLGGDNG
jgi:hypothetical protein